MAKQPALIGKNIYLDKHNQRIYYHPILKKAYRISHGDENRLKSLQSRYILAATVFAIFYVVLKISLIYSILAALAALIVLEVRFYQLLNRSSQLTLFKKENYTNTLAINAPQYNKKDVLIRTLLYLSLAVLLAIYIVISKDIQQNLTSQIIGWIVVAFAAIQTIQLSIQLLKK